MPLFARVELEFGEFGDAVDAGGDIVAELFTDLFDGDAGILDQIVQKARNEASSVGGHVGQNMGDFQGMHQVGFTGLALLPGVHLESELKGGREGGGIFGGVGGLKFIEEGLKE